MHPALEWWFNKDKFTNDEIALLHRGRSTIATTSPHYNKLCDEFYSRIPFGNLSSKTHELGLAIYATSLIQQLFKNYVNDDVLVITTDGEHNSARSCIEKSKNVFYFNYSQSLTEHMDSEIQKAIEESKKYKSVFIYIIGTQISNGYITPQLFFEKLKSELVKNNINHTLVIDDVHGMFTVPRDYTIFDYVIYTTHALVLGYDLGMVIYKKDKTPIGYKIYNWLKEYLVCLDIILKRKEKIYLFKPVFFEVFSKFYDLPNFKMPMVSAPQIFSPIFKTKESAEDIRNKFHKYKLSIDVSSDYEFVIRNRIGTLISYTKEDFELYSKGLDLLYNYIKMTQDM